MLEVIKSGLETSIQEWPGRYGYLNVGFPWSGPMDSWSFRLANCLVGNPPGAAALECQFIGPSLKFQRAAVFALTGAEMQAKLDGVPVALGESTSATAGQTLAMGSAKTGARGYLAIAGGIINEAFFGSRATFHKGGLGGMEGHALKVGQTVPVGNASGVAGRKLKLSALPPIVTNKKWQVEVVTGPNDDWIDDEGHARFLGSDWKLSSKSDRGGFRLDGPDWTFTARATNKPPEHGSDPANIVDHGYPVGAINLAGQTPIILVNDGPSGGGFINPYTVPQCAFWKLAQSKPGETYRFQVISVAEAQARARAIAALCTATSIE
ncbi:MAG: biotin-dependent carboxyltransferase [Gammaproteobacteria bacterium]|nr:biotin-dependent carboxyltransferase [Gammaproteobacteria bacterium]